MGRHRKNRHIKPSMPQPADSRSRPPVKRIHIPVTLSCRYIQPGGTFCLSGCDERGVRETVDCLRQLTTMSWGKVLQSGGRGAGKTGLGCTPYDDSMLHHVHRPKALDPTMQIAGVRASQRMRVFGAYFDHVFYLLWFDPTHKIVPAG
jgi:hypothetical protein